MSFLASNDKLWHEKDCMYVRHVRGVYMHRYTVHIFYVAYNNYKHQVYEFT